MRPVFKVDLGRNGGVFSPRSIAEAVAWIERERSSWDWVFSRRLPRQALEQKIVRLNEALRLLRDSGDSVTESVAAAIASQISSAFVAEQLPHSSSRIGKAIDVYRRMHGDEQGAVFALVVMDGFGSQSIQFSDIPRQRAMSDAFAFIRENWLESFSSETRESTFDEWLTKAESVLGEKSEQLDLMRADFYDSSELVRQLRSEQEGWDTSFREERGRQFDQMRASLEKRTAEIEAAFLDRMALQAPVSYWTDKATGHRRWAIIFAIASFVMLAVDVLALSFALDRAVPWIATGKIEPALAIGALLGLVLFFVWATRLLVRNYLSQSHLRADAQERVVMVQTYLALAEVGKVKTDEDRQLILQSLFRPATDGLVKDEGVPLSFADVLSRAR